MKQEIIRGINMQELIDRLKDCQARIENLLVRL
jgi:hypothetical protein